MTLIRRINRKLKRDIRPYIEGYPEVQDSECWILPAKMHYRGQSRPTVRAVFEEIAGEALDLSHWVRNECSNPACANPAHNRVHNVNSTFRFEHVPIPHRLTSSPNDDDEIADVLDLLNDTDPPSTQSLIEIFGEEVVNAALARKEQS